MRSFLKALSMLLVVVVVFTLIACSSNDIEFRYENDAALKTLIAEQPQPYPSAKFIVFSDPHIYTPGLGTEGAAFEEYINNDRKLLRESTRIMSALVDKIVAETADFVLVAGDLTKDGERVCHQLAASFLEEIEKSGKQVYVVPGNHDILNHEAFSYNGGIRKPVPNVTPDDFMQIYYNFGYSDALYRAPNSLSYVAEPVPGLWLLALDACRYAENKDSPITDGAFTAELLSWVEDRLIEAKKIGKSVIVMMHHGIMEHYKGQEKNFGDYIVDEYEQVGKLFAMYGVQLVFTGHYHAQDITVTRWEKEGKTLYDIETGSLVTYPCPYRLVNLNASRVEIKSKFITSIEGHEAGFPEYAQSYIESGIAGIAADTIEGYGVKPEAAEKLAKQVSNAFLAHYAGDEKLPSGQDAITSKGTGFRGWLVVFMKKGLIRSLWTDLEPADNDVTLELATGE